MSTHTNTIAYLMAGACALLVACGESHGPNAGSSGSNWLRCEDLSDCAGTAAVACSEDGYCVDADGERVEAPRSQPADAESEGASDGGAPSEAGAQPREPPNLDAAAPSATGNAPRKRGDVTAVGNVARQVLHLYVSNQSLLEPLVGIDVHIDGQHVVSGNFAVGDQHNRFEFSILVPVGEHILVALASNGTVLRQTLDIAGERWGVIDYWRSASEPAGFSVRVQDTPVAFQ